MTMRMLQMALNLAWPYTIVAFTAYHNGEISESLKIYILEWNGVAHGG